MKTIIIYSSQTGFTERYAKWLAEDLSAELITLAEAKKKGETFWNVYDAILYGGWIMGGRAVNSDFFMQHLRAWKGKKLAIFCVGASPNENPDVDKFLKEIFNEEQEKYAKAFFCQGGLDYDKMKLPARLAMKAFATMLQKKKDATDSEKLMGEMISHSYDISDRKFIDPIVEYIRS